jgi:hypothetical protein
MPGNRLEPEGCDPATLTRGLGLNPQVSGIERFTHRRIVPARTCLPGTPV